MHGPRFFGVGWLVSTVVLLSLLISAGPALVALMHAAVPLLIAGGAVVIGARIVWYLTSRY